MASAVSCLERSLRTVGCFTDGHGRGGLAGYLGVTRAGESGVHPSAPRKIPAF